MGDTTLSRYLYIAREYDRDTALQYNRRRWYDATTARWLTEDPIGFSAGDVNLTRYVDNGPGNAVDPSGLQQIAIPPGAQVIAVPSTNPVSNWLGARSYVSVNGGSWWDALKANLGELTTKSFIKAAELGNKGEKKVDLATDLIEIAAVAYVADSRLLDDRLGIGAAIGDGILYTVNKGCEATDAAAHGLNYPGRVYADYRLYLVAGLTRKESTVLSVGHNTPILDDIFAGEELSSGRSTRPQDIGQPLDLDGKMERASQLRMPHSRFGNFVPDIGDARIFYRGTTVGSASEILQQQAFDVERIQFWQSQYSRARTGVFITSQYETALYYADLASMVAAWGAPWCALKWHPKRNSRPS